MAQTKGLSNHKEYAETGKVSQPVRLVEAAKFKKGGAVHDDEEQDRALVKKMVKKSARTGKCSGGRVKGR